MTDLIIVCGIVNKKSEDILSAVIKNLDKHKFNNKYILFDGAPDLTVSKRYTNYKNYYKVNYPDFVFIENIQCLKYRKNLKLFIQDNLEGLSKNLLIIQDNILLDDFDLEKVLETKAVFDECQILNFREHRLRLNQWFNVVDDSQILMKTHSWNENAYLINKDKILNFLNNQPEDYYNDMMKDKCWETITDEEQLDYWKRWGCYTHKNIRFTTKRSSFT